MAGGSRYSAQTRSVLAALYSTPSDWRHGYDLAKETGLKSGTLYPILIRLADRQLVEACWEGEQPAGRPRRHLYRLSADGVEAARAALAATPTPNREPTPTRETTPNRETTPTRETTRPATPGRRGLAVEGV